MKKLLQLLLILLTISIVISGIDKPKDDYKLVWSDEFNNGGLDDTHFSTEWAWRGSALNTDDAIKIHNGNLEICPFTKDGYHNTGFITTYDKFNFTTGIIEIRVKFDMKAACWGDAWLTNDDILWDGDAAHSEEIDIFENRRFNKEGADISNGVNTNIFFPSYGPNMKYITRRTDNILDDNFHIFKLRRENNECEFYCDKKMLLKTVDPRPNCSLYLLLSVELDDGNWAGNTIEKYDGMPAMTVDYVRVYKKN